MDQLETGKDKIRKICDMLKSETLDPAKQEAQQIIAKAEEKARAIVHDAEQKAKGIIDDTHKKLQAEKKVFDESLAAAAKMGLDALRQDVESKLFDDELLGFVEKHSVDPALQAKLFKALVEALEKEGISADFSGYIGRNVPKEALVSALGQEILNKLKEKELCVGEFIGGVQLKLHDRRMILDISSEALKELLGRYIRKDFRALLFAKS